jgi:arginine/lysine/ornithine decarboxylase
MAMIVSVLKTGDKVIVQRNVHKSVTAGIIMTGVVPVYVEPVIDDELGIAHGVTPQSIQDALTKHPDAKAVLIVSPTYYGVVSDVRAIANIAHAHGIPLLVDEAHGAHFRFSPQFPEDAIAQGADLVSQSTHKTITSLTQSSMLHVSGDLVDIRRVAVVVNMLQTTSPSFMLLASLDCARRYMALNGRQLWDDTIELYQKTRNRINAIDGCEVFGKDHLEKLGLKGFDPTRLTICCWDLDISGHDMETLLGEKYHIVMELSDFYNVLAVGSPGDTAYGLDHLVSALQDISRGRIYHKSQILSMPLPDIPEVVMTPRDAFFGNTRTVDFKQSRGMVCAESIMSYPPGIPIICPGEVINQEIIDYIDTMKAAKLSLTGMEDLTMNTIKVVG